MSCSKSLTLVTALVVLVGLVAAAPPALARDVYLNGVKLDASVVIKDQTFPSCEVRFDAAGNVYITAKGFKIDVKPVGAGAGDGKAKPAPPASPPQAAPAKVEKRYWLVTRPAGKRGAVQYDVEVFVNGALVKRVRATDDPVILEVTRFVRVGDNQVQIVATKVMGDRRLSSSPTDSLEVLLGEGTFAGGTVSITRPLASVVRTAQETASTRDDVAFEGR